MHGLSSPPVSSLGAVHSWVCQKRSVSSYLRPLIFAIFCIFVSSLHTIAFFGNYVTRVHTMHEPFTPQYMPNPYMLPPYSPAMGAGHSRGGAALRRSTSSSRLGVAWSATSVSGKAPAPGAGRARPGPTRRGAWRRPHASRGWPAPGRGRVGQYIIRNK